MRRVFVVHHGAKEVERGASALLRLRSILPCVLWFSTACGGGDTVGPQGNIQLQSGSAVLVPGQSERLVASAVDPSGQQVTGASLKYQSSSPTVVSVDASGQMSARSTGSSTISVNASGFAGATRQITVLEGAWVTPAGGSFSAFGGAVQLTVPAGAVSLDRAIPIRVGSVSFPDPSTVVGSVYEVGTASEPFAAPVSLRLSFNAANGPFGLPVSGLGVRRLNGEAWDDLPGSIDQGASVAVANIPSTGTYAVGRIRPSTPCTGAEHRAFDFWLGEWDVGTGGAPFGRSSITLEPGGCAILEHYTDLGGTNGHSVNFFEPATGKWYQTYVDATPNGRIVLSGASPTPGRLEMKTIGAAAYQRWVWTLLSADHLTQVGSITTDGGNTFAAPFWDGQYRRRR